MCQHSGTPAQAEEEEDSACMMELLLPRWEGFTRQARGLMARGSGTWDVGVEKRGCAC